MDETTMDLEALTEGAWRGFREALADALEMLEPGACLQVALDAGDELDGASPYVQALRAGDSIVVDVASNRFLSTQHRLAKHARRRLRGLGLAKPSESAPNYWSSYARSHVDQAASVAVSVFRDAFGVVHPAFLISDDFTWQTDSHLPTAAVVLEASGAVYPADRQHLDALVDLALAHMLGHTPHRDSDGDIPITAGSAVVFVRSQGRTPLIRLFAEMVVEISDLDAADREVGVLNREIEGVKFAVHGDKVIASTDLLALPFAAEHLHLLVAHMCEVVSDNDAGVARRVGGRVFVDPEGVPEDRVDDGAAGADDDIHPVMMCMLQLDADKPGSLRPKLAAELCGYDCDLLLDLIRWNEEQEIAWWEARDEAYATDEFEQAAACEHERAHARRTVKILRKALRRVLIG